MQTIMPKKYGGNGRRVLLVNMDLTYYVSHLALTIAEHLSRLESYDHSYLEQDVTNILLQCVVCYPSTNAEIVGTFLKLGNQADDSSISLICINSSTVKLDEAKEFVSWGWKKALSLPSIVIF
jgi:hypothetical protein